MIFFLSINLSLRLAVLFLACLAALATTWSVTSDDDNEQQDKTRANANQRGMTPSGQFIIQSQPRLRRRFELTMARGSIRSFAHNRGSYYLYLVIPMSCQKIAVAPASPRRLPVAIICAIAARTITDNAPYHSSSRFIFSCVVPWWECWY